MQIILKFDIIKKLSQNNKEFNIKILILNEHNIN